MGLSFYQQDARALLRDSRGLFTPTAQLTRWINAGRKETAKVTGCLRRLIPGQATFGNQAQAGSMVPGAIIPGMEVGFGNNSSPTVLNGAVPTNTFNTIPGVEVYPYKFANDYLKRWYQGVKSVICVNDISVSWGGIRPTLDWLPWDDLQAYARSYNVGVTSYPFVWSTNRDGEDGAVWLFPIPVSGPASGTGEMEWDVDCIPLDLNTDADYDAIPEGFQDAVKYYAAYLSFLPTRPGMAEMMKDLFHSHLGIDRVASDRGKTYSYYSEFN